MGQGYQATHRVDHAGNPAGGISTSHGVHIAWQDGPLGRGIDRKDPNGAFIEDVIAIAIDRMKFYQDSANGKFRCRENSLVITKLEEALHWLDHRIKDREARGVQGTHDA
jgi:hypothetical protein